MWPAIVVDESLIGGREGLSKTLVGGSVSVQFFGTHDFARFEIHWHLRAFMYLMCR